MADKPVRTDKAHRPSRSFTRETFRNSTAHRASPSTRGPHRLRSSSRCAARWGTQATYSVAKNTLREAAPREGRRVSPGLGRFVHRSYRARLRLRRPSFEAAKGAWRDFAKAHPAPGHQGAGVLFEGQSRCQRPRSPSWPTLESRGGAAGQGWAGRHEGETSSNGRGDLPGAVDPGGTPWWPALQAKPRRGPQQHPRGRQGRTFHRTDFPEERSHKLMAKMSTDQLLDAFKER